MPTPDALGDLAESLVPVAVRLVAAVHDDGVAAVARVLSEVHTEHLPALSVVLAGMCDPDRTPGEMLAWVTWDEIPDVDQPSLLALADPPVHTDDVERLPADPREWSDEVAKWYHRAFRRKGGELDYRAKLGYHEWERRRKAAHRQGA